MADLHRVLVRVDNDRGAWLFLLQCAVALTLLGFHYFLEAPHIYTNWLLVRRRQDTDIRFCVIVSRWEHDRKLDDDRL